MSKSMLSVETRLMDQIFRGSGDVDIKLKGIYGEVLTFELLKDERARAAKRPTSKRRVKIMCTCATPTTGGRSMAEVMLLDLHDIYEKEISEVLRTWTGELEESIDWKDCSSTLVMHADKKTEEAWLKWWKRVIRWLDMAEVA